MSDAPQAVSTLSTLALEFEVLDERADWPVVSIRVDGKDPFLRVVKDWRGFDPDAMLGQDSPLVPDNIGRRIAVYRCSCGEPGCGVIAPFIISSPDNKRVSWVDFRDYVGVFVGPLSREVENCEGKRWDLPDIHFDRDQYLAEVERAASDRSWETSSRQIARLVYERLKPLGLVHPPNLTLAWVTPEWPADGAVLMFERAAPIPSTAAQQQLLHLVSKYTDPSVAADDMVNRLLSVPADQWAARFGRRVR